jgi:hypothetical protein
MMKNWQCLFILAATAVQTPAANLIPLISKTPMILARKAICTTDVGARSDMRSNAL